MVAVLDDVAIASELRSLEHYDRLAALGDVGATVLQRLQLLSDGRAPKAKLFRFMGHAEYAVFRALIPVGIATGIALGKQSTAIWTYHEAGHGVTRPQKPALLPHGRLFSISVCNCFLRWEPNRSR